MAKALKEETIQCLETLKSWLVPDHIHTCNITSNHELYDGHFCNACRRWFGQRPGIKFEEELETEEEIK